MTAERLPPRHVSTSHRAKHHSCSMQEEEQDDFEEDPSSDEEEDLPSSDSDDDFTTEPRTTTPRKRRAGAGGSSPSKKKKRARVVSTAAQRAKRQSVQARKSTLLKRRALLPRSLLVPSSSAEDQTARSEADPFARARAALHVSATPEDLPCREDEFTEVEANLEEAIEEGTGSCIYIAGVPGTGKTATVHSVVRDLRQRARNGVRPSPPLTKKRELTSGCAGGVEVQVL